MTPPAPEAPRPDAAQSSLAELLDRHTVVGTLWRTEDGKVRCLACGHRCLIAPDRRGVCKVRFHQAGQLRVPFGYVSGAACDPVEKKPFFHVLPGSDALTFGMLGCDYHCSYCQNWVTSQALRDPASLAPIQLATPAQLAAAARRHGARLLVSSYNEPLITAEWAAAVFQVAKDAGLLCAFVSNGNATPEVLDFLKPWLAACKVDLKGFDDRRYRSLGGTLRQVTETISLVWRRGLWLEVVTLVVPGFNDDEAELRDLARFLTSVSPDIPWHVTAFHPDYRLTEPDPTPVRTLLRAAQIGREQGLHYVYAGNLPGQVAEWENTQCPDCHRTLVRREGFRVAACAVTPQGQCPGCQKPIPGIWASAGDAPDQPPGPQVAHRFPRAVRLD